MSRQLTARSANARIRITNPTRIALENAVRNTRVTATATTRTTTVAAITMEAIAVRNLSKVEKSTHLTAQSASARIPSTKSRDATMYARLDSTSAMATATTRTTTATAGTMEATVAVPTSRKLTARSANARIRITNPTRVALEHAVSKITRVMATATTTTTTVAASTMEATVAVPTSKKTYCKECKCKDPNHKKKDPNCKDKCTLKDYIGDGNCDDVNNNCDCGYDGGDCCAKSVAGGTVKKSYCKECKCKDPKNK